MTKLQAEKLFRSELLESRKCLTLAELKARVGLTTLKCMWCDFTDALCKDHQISEKQYQNWGHPSYLKN